MGTGRPIDPSTQTFLVERYWPGINEPTLLAALRRLDEWALSLSSPGRVISHMGSLLVADDEVVFSLIQAPTEVDVRRLNKVAGMLVDRVSVARPMGLGPAPTTEGETRR